MNTQTEECIACKGKFAEDDMNTGEDMCWACWWNCEDCNERREGATGIGLCDECLKSMAYCVVCSEYCVKIPYHDKDTMTERDGDYYCKEHAKDDVCENCETDVSEDANVHIECMRNPEGEDVTWCHSCFETEFKEAAKEGWTWCNDDGEYVSTLPAAE